MNGKGRVVGIEHIKDLYKLGKENISKSHSRLLQDEAIKLVLGDGRQGYPLDGPYDCIHVGAGKDGA